MKKLLGSTLVVFLSAVSLVDAKPYLQTIFQDWKHPKTSLSALYTPSFEFDGIATDVAVVYHKADPENSLIPEKLLDLGMVPVSWTLLEAGGGGNSDNAFVHFGPSVDVAQTLLGPLVKILERQGGKFAAFGRFLVSPDGNGVRAGLSWKADVIHRGGFVPINDLAFPPRYKFGYTYQF